MASRDQALTFLTALFGDPVIADEGLQIALMSLTPGAKARPGYTFYSSVAGAADAAVKLAERGDNAYVCMSLLNPKEIKRRGGKRGEAKDSKGIVGFWADIDIADAHLNKKGKNPPVSPAEALQIVNKTGLAPTLVVETGHGLHCYWLLKKPWIFGDDSERDQAADMARAWEGTLQQIARDHGRTLDSVADLARVLRVPGTVNTKIPNLPKDVRLVVGTSPEKVARRPRYSVEEVASKILAPTSGQVDEIVKPQKLMGVEYRAPTPEERSQLEARIALIKDLIPRFSETWDRTRIDMGSGQSSASEYDLAIANALTEGDWSDQEILWALYLWRHRHGEDTDKILKRADYVELTLAKAKKSNATSVATRHLKQINTTVEHLSEQLKTSSDPQRQDAIKQEIDSKRTEVFDSVTKILGIQVTNFVKVGEGTEGMFYVRIKEGKEIRIGNSMEIQEAKKVCAAFIGQADCVPKGLQRTQWEEAVRGMMAYKEQRQDHTQDVRVRWYERIREASQGAEVIDARQRGHQGMLQPDKERYNSLLEHKTPFWLQNGSKDPTFVFWPEKLKTKTFRFDGEGIKYDDLTDALNQLKAAPKRLNGAMIQGKRPMYRAWIITKQRLDEIEHKLTEAYGSLDFFDDAE